MKRSVADNMTSEDLLLGVSNIKRGLCCDEEGVTVAFRLIAEDNMKDKVLADAKVVADDKTTVVAQQQQKRQQQ
jgi:hypothetical protein